MLRTIVVAVVIALYLLLVGVPFILLAMVTGNDGLLYRWGVRGARLALKAAGVRVRAVGRERIQPGQTYVFMSNHVGMAEPPGLVAVLPRISALLKHELMRVPVLGSALRVAGFIPVYRGTHMAAVSVDAGVETLRRGRCLLVFPEGTRSETGELQPFRRGVFLMAIRAGVPIVPITVLGSREIMRKGDRRIHPGELTILIHEPVPTTGLGDGDRGPLADRVRAIIASALP